ncbi:MAG: glycosyltransferase [Actinomycetota bacterium]|nr:glycosyltransferase [Actinomycetota bacterium]
MGPRLPHQPTETGACPSRRPSPRRLADRRLVDASPAVGAALSARGAVPRRGSSCAGSPSSHDNRAAGPREVRAGPTRADEQRWIGSFFPGRSRRPGVSVVIPVYNTGPYYLAPCLDSVLAQDLPPDELEVVAVDDGSTDGSGELLDTYAARHPKLRVLHQENSGWPGRPRNVGVAESRGTFVYFVDADDYLAPQALRRMWEFAIEHASDVLVPRVLGVEGRGFSHEPWRTTQVDADLTRAFLTLAPMKMFRRSFLDRQGLRFPEGKVRLEDGIFLAEAYLTAARVSILGGYDFYF